MNDNVFRLPPLNHSQRIVEWISNLLEMAEQGHIKSIVVCATLDGDAPYDDALHTVHSVESCWTEQAKIVCGLEWLKKATMEMEEP